MQDEQSGDNQQPGSDGPWPAPATGQPAQGGDAGETGGLGQPGQGGGYGYGHPGQGGGYGYGQPGQGGGYGRGEPGRTGEAGEPGQGGGPGGFGYGPPGGYGYGQPGGYGPPSGGGYGQGGYGPPGDFIQQQPPLRRRLNGLVAYIAVAAVAAAAGAGTVLLADHFDSHSGSGHPAASQQNTPSGGGFNQPAPGSGPRSRVSSATEQSVYNAVQPGIVNITSNLRYQGGTAAATGMIISKSGLVLTNNHVINGTTGLKATVVATGRTYTTRYLGYDKADDIAVLQIEGGSGLRTVPLGNSTGVSVGDGVIALGNAGGTGQTTTVTGSITGLNQTITASDDGSATSERLTGMLRTNASIVPGDSGGPLASTSGKVIGMNTAAATGSTGIGQQNVGFAIPINRALRIAQQIIAGKSSPTVQIGSTGFLGVLVPAAKASRAASPAEQRRLQILGEQNGTGAGVPRAQAGCIPSNLQAGVPAKVAPVSTGALVLGELCGTPAASAGMLSGDVITSVNGRPVTTPNSLTSIMRTFRPGNKVSVTWADVNSGQRVTRTLTLAMAPPQ